MKLSFSTKFFGRMEQVSSSFGKTLGTLVSTTTKCIKLISIGKITLVLVAFFNGSKYINKNEIPW